MNSSIAKPKSPTVSAKWSCVVEAGQSYRRCRDGVIFDVKDVAPAGNFDACVTLVDPLRAKEIVLASILCGPNWERLPPAPLPKVYQDEDDNETGIWTGGTHVGPVGARA